MTYVSRRFSRASRTRRWLTALLAGGAVLVPTTAWASGPASPSASPSAPVAGPKVPKAEERATFGIQPATGTVPDQRPFYDYGLAPLSTVKTAVAIVNYGTVALDLAVYATDALNSSEGGFGLKPAVAKPTDAGAWIAIGRPTRSVHVRAANSHGPGRVILPVTITIPGNAQPGDHAAGIIASLNTLGKNPQGQNVRLEQRVASRVYLRIAGDLRPGLTITGFTTKYHAGGKPWVPGSLDVTYVVNNTGNVRLGFTPSLDVRGPAGLFSRHDEGDVFPELLPGNAHRITTTIKDVWPTFRVSTRLTLRPVAAPGADAPNLTNVTASTSVVAIPWLLLASLVLIGLAVWQLRRQRRRAKGSRGPTGGAGDPTGGPSGPRSTPARELVEPRAKASR